MLSGCCDALLGAPDKVSNTLAAWDAGYRRVAGVFGARCIHTLLCIQEVMGR